MPKAAQPTTRTVATLATSRGAQRRGRGGVAGPVSVRGADVRGTRVAERPHDRAAVEQQGKQAPREQQAEGRPDQPRLRAPSSALAAIPELTSQGASATRAMIAPSSSPAAARSPTMAPIASISGLQLNPRPTAAALTPAIVPPNRSACGISAGRASRNQMIAAAKAAAISSSTASPHGGLARPEHRLDHLAGRDSGRERERLLDDQPAPQQGGHEDAHDRRSPRRTPRGRCREAWCPSAPAPGSDRRRRSRSP